MVILKTIRKIYENINNGNDFNSHFKSQAAQKKNRSKQKENKIHLFYSFFCRKFIHAHKIN